MRRLVCRLRGHRFVSACGTCDAVRCSRCGHRSAWFLHHKSHRRRDA